MTTLEYVWLGGGLAMGGMILGALLRYWADRWHR